MSQVLMSEMCAVPSSLLTPISSQTFGFQQGDPIVISGAQSENSASKDTVRAECWGKVGLGLVSRAFGWLLPSGDTLFSNRKISPVKA